MTTSLDLRIVDATPQHAPFIAWTMLTAARSHLEVGFYDLFSNTPEPETLRFLEAVTTTDNPQTAGAHWGHHAIFIVAEIDGVPASALSGYVQREHNETTVAAPMMAALKALGRPDTAFADGLARAGSFLNVAPEHDDNTWVVEHVATAPEFRRRGLTDRLLTEILDRGRSRGCTTADIGVLMENDRAQAAYEKAGFTVVEEKRDAAFEAAYKCPGIRLLRRAL
jgi:ribosomal protein S18 acetylase RimI-like enzyme